MVESMTNDTQGERTMAKTLQHNIIARVEGTICEVGRKTGEWEFQVDIDGTLLLESGRWPAEVYATPCGWERDTIAICVRVDADSDGLSWEVPVEWPPSFEAAVALYRQVVAEQTPRIEKAIERLSEVETACWGCGCTLHEHDERHATGGGVLCSECLAEWEDSEISQWS